jgi:tetratricopeptide (TPR) repeat protein
MKLARSLLWLLGLGVLAAAAVLIAKSALWKPEAPERGEKRPHWPAGEGERPDEALVAALTLEGEGRLEDAVAKYGEVLERAPENWLARIGRAKLLERLGRPEEARDDLAALTRAQPRNVTGWLHLAALAVRLGDGEGARRAAKTALDLRPDHADPYLIMSDVDAEADLEKSLASLEEYLRRVWAGNFHDDAMRRQVEDREGGKYLRRVMERFRRQLPEGPERDARAEIEARWYMAGKYLDFAVFGTKSVTLSHLKRYLDLVRVYGDPDAERFARAQEMAARLKQEIRQEESRLSGSGSPAPGGTPTPPAP